MPNLLHTNQQPLSTGQCPATSAGRFFGCSYCLPNNFSHGLAQQSLILYCSISVSSTGEQRRETLMALRILSKNRGRPKATQPGPLARQKHVEKRLAGPPIPYIIKIPSPTRTGNLHPRASITRVVSLISRSVARLEPSIGHQSSLDMIRCSPWAEIRRSSRFLIAAQHP